MTKQKKPFMPYNIDQIIKGIKKAFDEITAYPDDYCHGYDEDCHYFLDEIASGAQGIYQPDVIMNFFQIKMPDNIAKEIAKETGIDIDDVKWSDDEFVWDEIDSITSDISDEISDLISKRDRNLFEKISAIYFGHLEADGSYGLFVSFDKDIVEKHAKKRR